MRERWLFAVLVLGLGTATGSADIFWSTGRVGTNLISIDTNTGSVIQNHPFHGFRETWAGAFDTDGTFYTLVDGFTAPRLSTFNLETGAVTAFAGITAPEAAVALEVDAAGNMFAAGFVSGTLYSVNKVSGEFSPIGNFGITRMMDLVFDSTGRLWGTVANNLYEINPTTGTLISTRAISGIRGEETAMGIAVDASDNFFLTVYESLGRFYGLDPASGAANFIGRTGVDRPHGGDIRCDPCDMNCDGMVDASDIEFFIDILFNGATPCGSCTGDTNGDGNINAEDIEGFINCLFP